MDSQKDSYFTRNVCGVSAVEFLWGLGFPIVLESTFLQLFLRSLGGSGFIIGLVPSILIIGTSCFPLFSSYFTRNYRYKKPIVILLHLLSALSVFFFGLALLFVRNPAHVLPLFFVSYVAFSICLGLTIPIWFNYLVRIFPEARTVPGLGYMMLFQNIGKVISSFFILKVVERYAFSLQSSAWVFIATGLLFIIGSLCFLLTREIGDADDPLPDRLSFFRHTAGAFVEIVGNRRFLVFLAADLDFYMILTVLGFYANYATVFYEVPAAVAAGIFVACIYTGSITVNIFLGAMNLLSLKQKFVMSKFVTFALLLLLVVYPDRIIFFLVSYLLGVGRAVHNVVYPTSVKHFARKADITPYFSLAPILTLPFAAGFPLLFGWLLDHFASMQADSYRMLFGFSALLSLVTIYLSIRTDYAGAGNGRKLPEQAS